MCRKSQFHCKKKVEFSAISAIAEFNFGPVLSMEFRQADGDHSFRLSMARQRKRLRNSENAATGITKERQKKRKLATEKAQKEYEKQHGTTGYGPGLF